MRTIKCNRNVRIYSMFLCIEHDIDWILDSCPVPSCIWAAWHWESEVCIIKLSIFAPFTHFDALITHRCAQILIMVELIKVYNSAEVCTL